MPVAGPGPLDTPAAGPAPLEIPPPEASVEARLEGDVPVSVRRYGNPDGPRLLLSHGNGLASDLYYPFWSLLLDRFDVLVFDLRNHGANPVGGLARHTIPTLCRDLEAVGRTVDRAFGVRPRVGVFHSVSGLTAALSPALAASYAGLVLFDPPLTRPGATRRAFEAACRQAAARSRIRVGRFRSAAEFVALMGAQPAMARIDPEVLRLLARTTLRALPDGGRALRCPPEHEAQILKMIPRFSRMVDVASLPLPVRIVGADPSLRHTFLPPCDFRGARSVDFEYIPGTTHLAQLERPEACARLTADFLRRIGFSPS